MISPLSERATTYLASKERVDTIIDPGKIAQVFTASKVPLFAPLIDFQHQFGGYVFHAGTVSITFGLIQQKEDATGKFLSEFIRFTKSERREGSYQFICALSEHPIEFELDEQGRYYEDGKPVAKTIGKFIERMALYAEMKSKGGFQQIGNRTNKDEELVIKNNRFEIIPEASDDMTQWYQNETMYMEVVLGVMTIFGRVIPVTEDDPENPS